MTLFADRLTNTIEKNESFVIAGFDPVIENLPAFFLKRISAGSASNDEMIREVLISYHVLALEALHTQIAGVKINTAFFEQYGIPGLSAMQTIAAEVQRCGLPLIADAKRGDIGSTAQAYSNAFLGRARAFGSDVSLLNADALTVNPFLGFDTLEVFIKDCVTYGKGLFILVKTSNQGSAAIQNVKSGDGKTVSLAIAEWIADNSAALRGSAGFSGLGAVVAATYPEEAKVLRKAMPDSFFLMPGFAAQGGSASDAAAGFSPAASGVSKFKSGGAVINASRALLGEIPEGIENNDELKLLIQARIQKFNDDITVGLK